MVADSPRWGMQELGTDSMKRGEIHPFNHSLNKRELRSHCAMGSVTEARGKVLIAQITITLKALPS